LLKYHKWQCAFRDVKLHGDDGFKRHEKISSSMAMMSIALYYPLVVGECFSQMTLCAKGH